jgi:hypothetical protein
MLKNKKDAIYLQTQLILRVKE